MGKKQSKSAGCGIGCFIGAFLSYALNGSFWWSILHFFLSWVYVVYALFFRTHDIVQYFTNAA